MTRSQFILGIALLVVAGTLAFTVSFKNQEELAQRSSLATSEKAQQSPSSASYINTGSKKRSQRISTRAADRTRYEVSVADLSQKTLAQKIQRSSISQLEEMTDRYQLTGTQRRQLFPLLAKHHPEFIEGMMINGQSPASPSENAQLASEVYPLLDPTQQDLYQDDLLSEDQWWSEIISQLRDDLDQAIESGEMIAVDENGVEIPATPIIDDAPAEGDGSAIEPNNGGINLESLFGQ